VSTAQSSICFREDRLKFWSDPDKEVKLAKDTGVTVFRMGVDWSRIMPVEPTKGIKEAVSQENIMTRYVLHILYVSMHFLLFCHFLLKLCISIVMLCRLTMRLSNTINGYLKKFVQME